MFSYGVLVLFPSTLSRIQGVFVETKPVRDEAFRGTPTPPDTSRNRPAGAPLRPPVIDGIEEHDPAGRIEEHDFLESGMPSSRLGCPLSLKTPNMGNPG